MKRIVAGILTLVAVVAIFRWKSGEPTSGLTLSSPEECVQRMFESLSQGDVQRYLSCFAEPERERLAREVAGQSASSASDALRRSVADVKGWALLDPPAANQSASCSLTVEWVYATRVDRQRLELRRDSDGWRIARVEQVRPGQPPIPYGTPVSGPIPRQ